MASINFTTYTETDPSSKLTVDSATQYTFTAVDRSHDVRLHKDYGAGYFTDSIPLQFEYENTASVGTSLWIPLLLSNVLGTEADLNGTAAHIYIQDNSVTNNKMLIACLNRLASGATDGRDDGTNLDLGNRLITYSRSGKTVTVIVYTGPTVGPIEYTLTFTAINVIPDYRYHYAANVREQGGAATISGVVKNYEEGAAAAVTFNRSRVVNMGVTGPQNRSTIANA